MIAVPEAGYFFPSNVVPYEAWLIGLNVPYTEFACEYLSGWYHSYLDESCVKANPEVFFYVY